MENEIETLNRLHKAYLDAIKRKDYIMQFQIYQKISAISNSTETRGVGDILRDKDDATRRDVVGRMVLVHLFADCLQSAVVDFDELVHSLDSDVLYTTATDIAKIIKKESNKLIKMVDNSKDEELIETFGDVGDSVYTLVSSYVKNNGKCLVDKILQE